MCEVDWFVGQVLAALDRVGVTEQTLVVFTSDNGSPQRDGTVMSGAVGSVLDGTFAIRVGRWKLILGKGSGGFSGWKPPANAPAGQLHDLEEDPGEEVNAYAEDPEIVAQLESRPEEIRGSGRPVPSSDR